MKTTFARSYILAVSLYAGTAFGVPWDPPTDAEIAALPPYCATKFKNLPDYGHWVQVLGPSFHDVHHYCDALYQINRYYKSRNPADQKFFIQNALGNLDYMFSHAMPTQPRDVLLPEVHFTKGKVLLLAGKDSEAAREFLQAIQLKPDYADPYAALADFYSRIGKKQDALKTLEEGLKQVPASRSLARRYQELGGKNPLPAPPPPAAATAQPSPPESSPAVSADTESKKDVAPPTAAPDHAKPEPAHHEETVPGKIGSPSNPWCRFCPDTERATPGK